MCEEIIETPIKEIKIVKCSICYEEKPINSFIQCTECKQELHEHCIINFTNQNRETLKFELIAPNKYIVEIPCFFCKYTNALSMKGAVQEIDVSESESESESENPPPVQQEMGINLIRNRQTNRRPTPIAIKFLKFILCCKCC